MVLTGKERVLVTGVAPTGGLASTQESVSTSDIAALAPVPESNSSGPAPAVSFSGTTTASSTTVSALSTTSGLLAGQQITGVGIEALTTIVSVNAAASSLVLSQAASYSNTTPMTAYPIGLTGLVPASPAVSLSRTQLWADGTFSPPAFNSRLFQFDNTQAKPLPHFRAARYAIQSAVPIIEGAGNTPNSSRNVLVFGDSVAVGNDPNIPSWTISPWYAAFNMLNASSFGGIWHWDSGTCYTDGLSGPGGLTAMDPRWSFGAGWSAAGSFPGISNMMVNAVDTSSLVFTPSLTWDKMDIIYRGPAGASWTYTIGAGSPVTVTQSGSDRIVKLTITAASNAVQALTINRVSGNVQLSAFNPYQSTKYQLVGVQLAAAGGSVAGLATINAEFSPTVLNTMYAPCLIIFHYGYEIAGQRSSPGIPAATVVANFITNMNIVIQAWQALGVDIMLMSMHPWDDTNLYKDQATVLQARAAIYQIAQTNNVPMIDNFARWGSWTAAVANGFLQHYARPLPAGGHDLGAGAYQALNSD